MKKIVVLLLTYSLLLPTFAQESCGMQNPTNNTPTPSNINCGGISDYSPFYPNHTPVKKVQIMLHVFGDENGKKNFENTPSGIAELNALVSRLNTAYNNLGVLIPAPTSPYIADARIQFVVSGIYFYQNKNVWDLRKYEYKYEFPYITPNTQGFLGDSIYNNMIMKNSSIYETDKQSNLHVMIGGSSKPWEGGYASDFGNKKYTFLFGYYYLYQNHYEYYTNKMVWHMGHEIGHNLGLLHSGCDDCDDNGCRSLYETNNFMDYINGKKDEGYGYSQCQLATMHYYLSGQNYHPYRYNNILTNISDCVEKDYCLKSRTIIGQTSLININSDVTWSSIKNLQSDVSIENGGSLTVKCSVGLPYDAQVTVKNGGRLLIDNGDFNNRCDKSFQGIVVENGGYLEISTTTNIDNYDIKVLSGGTLRIMDLNGMQIGRNGRILAKKGSFISLPLNNNVFNLKDENSLIYICAGTNFGVNPVLNLGAVSSIGSIAGIPIIGLGKVLTGSSASNPITINNVNYTTSVTVNASEISTNNVTVSNNSKLDLYSTSNTTLKPSFKVELGSSLYIDGNAKCGY